MHTTKELNDEEFFKQKSDMKIILLGDSAVGKSKYVLVIKYHYKFYL
jgi:hypothetical protein